MQAGTVSSLPPSLEAGRAPSQSWVQVLGCCLSPRCDEFAGVQSWLVRAPGWLWAVLNKSSLGAGQRMGFQRGGLRCSVT